MFSLPTHIWPRILHGCFGGALLFSLSLAWAQPTPAGTVIRNQAIGFVGGVPVASSNPVETVVQAVCVPSVTPNGTPDVPAYVVRGFPGQRVYLAYQLANLGNASFTLALGWQRDTAPWTPSNVAFYHDLNENGQLDPGEPGLTQATLGPGQSLQILVEVGIPLGASGVLHLSPTATCPDGSQDADNYSRLVVRKPYQVMLLKEVSPSRARPGDRLTYTITLINTGEEEALIRLEDTPDPGLVYLPGTASSAEPTVQDGRLVWENLRLDPGQRLVVRYQMRIGSGGGDLLENVAQATGIEGAQFRVLARASALVRLEPGVFIPPHNLVGRVFLDVDRDGRYTPGVDVPLPGARVVLGNGLQATTDAEGRYGFRNMVGGWWALLLELASAPFKPRPHPGAQGEGYHHRVWVEGLTQSDFPLEPPEGLVQALRETTLTFGPLTVRKKLLPLPQGVRVVLELKSLEALPELTLTDPLPQGGERVFRFERFEGQETLIYDLPGPAFLTDPQVRWRYP
ncbi:DUF11 domain-containing protein [Meiothermus rufus]|uniref:DUF11 domain-containing protein n=1 Tax=Meiothermus rufus TaxID=604332 RepID=UPI000424C3D4|nr:DUF11 domain-containing protein [Meiothermus rufus]